MTSFFGSLYCGFVRCVLTYSSKHTVASVSTTASRLPSIQSSSRKMMLALQTNAQSPRPRLISLPAILLRLSLSPPPPPPSVPTIALWCGFGLRANHSRQLPAWGLGKLNIPVVIQSCPKMQVCGKAPLRCVFIQHGPSQAQQIGIE